ncbi:MAG TPA: sulfatase [Chthoniobacteraceae bacterium]|nr:sulfatase [Chthoniobacteraceae bacterium]
MNVLLITWHDLGCHLGCYGRKDVVSPCLDRLAAEGVRLDSLFATNPICSPARGSLMSGLYPHRHGLEGLVSAGWSLQPEIRLVEDYFGEAGSHTAIVGHQHERWPATSCRCDDLWVESSRTADVVPQVCSRLRQYAASGTKFFLRAGFFDVHRPFAGESTEGWERVEPLPYLKDTEEHRKQLAQFHRKIRRADQGVGEILATLESTGLADGTLVVFLTDHGVPFPGAKLLLYDAGLRVAGLLRAPGTIAAGQAYRSLTSGVDILPTLLDLTGIPYSPEQFDGRSFAPALRGEPDSPRKYIHAERAMPVLMRAVRDERFKYILNFDRFHPQRLIGTEELTTSLSMAIPDTLRRGTPTEELYDLDSDPCEAVNLASDPAHAGTMERLRKELRRWMRAGNDPLLRREVLPPAFEAAWRLLTPPP